MDKGQLDKLRGKLYDVEVPVDADIWNGIESSLRRRKLRRMFLYASSAAAILIAALLVSFPEKVSNDPAQLVAQLPAIEQTVEIMEPDAIAEPDAPAAASATVPAVKPSNTGSRQAISAAQRSKETAMQSALQDPRQSPEKVQEDAAAPQVQQETESDKPASPQDILDSRNYTSGNQTESEDFPALEKKWKDYTVSLHSGVLPGSTASVAGGIMKASSAGAGNISQSHTIEQISDTKYSLPLNLGVQFQFPIGENMALGLGANYTMLRSRYDCLINKKKFSIKQTLHYIGIPVNIYGLIVDKNSFRFYLNAGAAMEKGIRAVYHLKSYDSDEHNSSNIDGMLFSVNAGMGVEYMLGNTVGLYLEPNIVYYLNSDIPHSIRTDQPLQVKAELGFRFRF